MIHPLIPLAEMVTPSSVQPGHLTLLCYVAIFLFDYLY